MDDDLERDTPFRVLFDSAPIGMAVIDLHDGHAGWFLRVNAALCGLTGYTEAELLATSSPAITHSGDRAATVHNLDLLSRGDVARWDTEKRYTTASGGYVWVHFVVSVVHDADGHPSYGVTQVEDITTRRQAQYQLAERFQKLATNVDVGFVVLQLDPPAYVYVNPAFCAIFGLPDVDGRALDPQLPRSLAYSDADKVWSGLSTAAAGEPVSQEWRFVLSDGQPRWVAERMSPIVDEQGHIAQVAGVFEDITDRKSVELALRESETRLDQLARHTDVGVVLRTDREVLYVNPSVSRIFGRDVNDPGLKVTDFLAMVHPDDVLPWQQFQEAVARGDAGPQELRILWPDGQLRWISVTTAHVRTPEGEPTRIASTITDVTERRAAQDAASTARNEAERANAAKDEFLSRMSHELRTPLNAILGFQQLLELSHLSEEQLESVEQIRQAGEHLLTLIDEVLDITAIEAGSLRLSMEPVSVGDVTDEAVAMLQPLAAKHQVSIAVDIDGFGAYVRADRQRLKQVLVNLLANAVKYNRKGGHVRVSASTEGNELHLSVSDSGIGIAEADLPRLFQPFQRFATEQIEVEGTGLGLALSRRLVSAMGGRLEVTSRVNEGSVFSLQLPETQPDSVAGELATPRSRAVPASAHSDGRTVLYIEDNSSNVRLMERILAHRTQITLRVATNGVHGLQLALEHQPDLILLDLHLPGLSGEEVLSALRKDPRTTTTPVAVLSGDAMPGAAARLLAAGATRYVTKPLDIHRVLTMVDELISAQPIKKSAVSTPAQGPAPAWPMDPPETGVGATVAAQIVREFVHDVNNELGVILNYSTSLNHQSDAAASDNLGAIHTAARTVAGLVANLLALVADDSIN